MPFGVPGPAPHVIDSLGSTRADCASIDDALLFRNAPSSLETRVPLISERPWTTPEGFICVYEKFFPLSILELRLSPRLFLRSRAERDLFHLARSVRILRSKLGSIIVGASVIWKGTFPLYQPWMLVRREMGSGPGSFPQVESLREREAYENACRKSCEVNF